MKIHIHSIFVLCSSSGHFIPEERNPIGQQSGFTQMPVSISRPYQEPRAIQPAPEQSRLCLKLSGSSDISYVAAGQCYFETVSPGIMKSRWKYKDIILSDNQHISFLRIFSHYGLQLSAHRYSRLQCVGVTNIRHVQPIRCSLQVRF